MSERTNVSPVAAPSLFETIRRPRPAAAGEDDGTDACGAFGYVRGIAERSVSVEFRFRNGNREAFPYSLFAGFRFDPSFGLLLKFTLDVTVLVAVRGSNLDLPVHQGAVDLIWRGLGGQRVIWIKEMDADEVRRAGLQEPTVDGIEVAECESQQEVRDWLKARASCFCRGERR